MFARPDASPQNAAQNPGSQAPKPADLGALPAMRQTLNDFSLDSLSSLLDDELSLESAATPAVQQPPASVVQPQQTAPEAIAQPHAPAPTEFIATQPVVIPSPRASAVTAPVPAAVRQSSLDETQLYKSTPQPTIDLSTVRRSASEPTQAFVGDLAAMVEVSATSLVPANVAATSFMPVDASATIPAIVDPSKSSVPETTFWSAEARDSARLEAMTAPVADAASLGLQQTAEAKTFCPAPTFATELLAPTTAPEPGSGGEGHDDSPAITTPRTIAKQLAGFFKTEPKGTTEVKWEQAVESDRRFTTMLLSDLDEAIRSETTEGSSSPAFSIADSGPHAAPYAAPPATEASVYVAPVEALPAEAPRYDVLDVVSPQPSAAPEASLVPTPAASEPAPRGRAGFLEPSPEIRQLASYLFERSTPGVSTVVAVVGCDETRPGAEATLALAAAVADATGVSTLVVDGDFAMRDLSRAVNAVEAPGFAETLSQPTKGPSFVQSCGRDNLQALPAGNAPPDSSEAPARVSAWIARAKQEYGLILVWLGSSSGEYERRLCGAADLSLLLATVERDRPSRIESAAERLRSVNARTLGVALVTA